MSWFAYYYFRRKCRRRLTAMGWLINEPQGNKIDLIGKKDKATFWIFCYCEEAAITDLRIKDMSGLATEEPGRIILYINRSSTERALRVKAADMNVFIIDYKDIAKLSTLSMLDKPSIRALIKDLDPPIPRAKSRNSNFGTNIKTKYQ